MSNSDLNTQSLENLITKIVFVPGQANIKQTRTS